MMKRVLPLAIVACKSAGSGVDIEITPPSGTAQVELLVAPDTCSDNAGGECATGIAWPMLVEQPPGTIYSLDNDTRNVLPVTKDGEAVTFRLEAGDDRHVDRLAVIAFDGSGSATAAKLLSDVTIPSTAQIWKVALDAIMPIDSMLGPPAAGAPTELTQVWRPPMRTSGTEDPATFASCYAHQSWDSEQLVWNREVLAPVSDPDCDNEAIECNPYWYDYDTSLAASPCLTEVAVGTAPACTVGGSLCADGKSNSTTCTFPNMNLPVFCVPEALCTCTNPGTLATCVRAEVDGATANTGAVTYVDCSPFPSDSTSSSGAGPCTSNNENQMELRLPVVGATHVSIGLLSVPPGAPLATDSGTFLVGTATFSMMTDPTNGIILLTWEKGAAPMRAPDFIIDVQFAVRHVLVPLKFGFTFGMPCPPQALAVACTLRGMGSGDSEFHCSG